MNAAIVILGAIALVMGVVLALWRRAAARVIELEAAKLTQSFKAEAERDAEKKKQQIAAQLAAQNTAADAMTPAELEQKVNE